MSKPIERRDLWTSKNPNRQTTKYIVIHHAAAQYRPGDAVRAIYTYHKSRFGSYNAAGYHVICQIELDGSIKNYLVNPPNMQGAGVLNRNHETFHICAATHFYNNVPSDAWINALRDAVAYAQSLYPNAEIVGHKDIATPQGPTQCPGGAWPSWKDRLMTNTQHVPIIGGETVNPKILYNALNRHSNHLTLTQKDSIVQAFSFMGEITSVGNLLPFAQSIHETGWFASPRFMQSRNPAGLGATDDGAWGSVFETIAAGVFAQYAHLLCYAKPELELNYIQKQIALLSPRRDAMRRAYGLGAAQNNWRGLTHKWNTPKPEGRNYATRIIELAERIKVM